VSSMDINVDTSDGKVTLRGTVPTKEARVKAEEAVSKVDGVKSVDNLLSLEHAQPSAQRPYR